MISPVLLLLSITSKVSNKKPRYVKWIAQPKKGEFNKVGVRPRYGNKSVNAFPHVRVLMSLLPSRRDDPHLLIRLNLQKIKVVKRSR